MVFSAVFFSRLISDSATFGTFSENFCLVGLGDGTFDCIFLLSWEYLHARLRRCGIWDSVVIFSACLVRDMGQIVFGVSLYRLSWRAGARRY